MMILIMMKAMITAMMMTMMMKARMYKKKWLHIRRTNRPLDCQAPFWSPLLIPPPDPLNISISKSFDLLSQNLNISQYRLCSSRPPDPLNISISYSPLNISISQYPQYLIPHTVFQQVIIPIFNHLTISSLLSTHPDPLLIIRSFTNMNREL